MSVVLYAKEKGCRQCEFTAKVLKKNGVPFETVILDKDQDARDYVASLGYMQAPVVVNGEDHWSGFRPDKLDALKASMENGVEEDFENVTSHSAVRRAVESTAVDPLEASVTAREAVAMNA